MIVIDVSPNYSRIPNAADVLNLKVAGVEGVIIGGEVVDVTAWRQYIAAYGDLFMGVYAFVEFDGQTQSIDNGLAAIAGMPCRYFGVDIENEGFPNPADNIQAIGACVARVNAARPDVETLGYTAPWWWRAYAGGSTETFGCRGWISGGAFYSNPDEALAPPLPARMPVIGGWNQSNTAFWQYQGSVWTANIWSDRNVRIMEGDMTPQELADFNDLKTKFYAVANSYWGTVQQLGTLTAHVGNIEAELAAIAKTLSPVIAAAPPSAPPPP